MSNNLEVVKQVRARSHASLKDCTAAVNDAGGDVEAALKLLTERGIIKGAERARVANQGRAETYVHPGAKLSVLVEINCETDFSAASPLFKEFCANVAMQIAAMNPRWIDRADVPAAETDAQRQVFLAQIPTGKPQNVTDKILAGKIDKWFAEVCLLEQTALTSEGGPRTIEQTRAILSSSLGETIKIRRFTRWEVGEGIEKPATDFAADVAAAQNVGS